MLLQGRGRCCQALQQVIDGDRMITGHGGGKAPVECVAIRLLAPPFAVRSIDGEARIGPASTRVPSGLQFPASAPPAAGPGTLVPGGRLLRQGWEIDRVLAWGRTITYRLNRKPLPCSFLL